MNPEQFERIILFISMFNDIDWTKKGNSDVCISNATEVSDYVEEFQRGHWSFLGPGDEENGKERTTTSKKENGTSKPIK